QHRADGAGAQGNEEDPEEWRLENLDERGSSGRPRTCAAQPRLDKAARGPEGPDDGVGDRRDRPRSIRGWRSGGTRRSADGRGRPPGVSEIRAALDPPGRPDSVE